MNIVSYFVCYICWLNGIICHICCQLKTFLIYEGTPGRAPFGGAGGVPVGGAGGTPAGCAGGAPVGGAGGAPVGLPNRTPLDPGQH